MPQRLAPFHLQSEIRNTNTTAKAGAVLPLQMLHATGVLEAADSIGLRPNRGFEDRDHVTATALLNLLGLGSCDDMKYLRDDAVLGYLCRETGEHHGCLSGKQKLANLWIKVQDFKLTMRSLLL
jgi:hypothetical protein